MKGLDYNVALCIFFPFYVAAEIPSNIMMKRTRPSLWIPFIMVVWGVITTLMGIVKSYPGLLVARAALGIAEVGHSSISLGLLLPARVGTAYAVQ